MKVLYVLHQFFPKYHSGTEQFCLALARAGRALGDDVRVFALDPDFRDPAPVGMQQFDWDGVPTTIWSFDKSMDNWILRDYDAPEIEEPFARVLDEFEPDVVHVFHLRWLGVDRLEQLERRGIPFVVHLMDFWHVCPNFLLLRPDGSNCDGPPDGGMGCLDCVWNEVGAGLRASGALAGIRARAESGEAAQHEGGNEQLALAGLQRLPKLRAALRKAAKVYAPSATVGRVLQENGHAFRELELAPYALDRSRLAGAGAAEATPRPITVGFCGTFAPHKGVDLLLRGFRKLARGDVLLELHGRFGDDPDFDEQLRSLADGDERIRFPGPFRREDLGRVLSGLDVLVVPSRWRENTPFVCLEARASGIRLLVADLSGMTEALPEGRGRSFTSGDADSLCRSLERLLDEVEQEGRRLAPDASIPEIRDQYAAFRRDYVRLASAVER